MSKCNDIAFVFFLLIASSIAGTNGLSPTVTAVTLWQFGRPRLLGGDATLPLRLLGTASDGSATTYLYQVANLKPVAATDKAGVLILQTTAVPTPRTIVAFASGWVEPFSNGGIECSLINSGFGACMDTTVGGGGTTANSGVPTPVVLQAALTVPTAPPNPPSVSSPPPDVGRIIGGAVGGCCVLVVGLILVLLALRRRRLQQLRQEFISPLFFYTAPQIVEVAATTTIKGSEKHRQGGVRATNRDRGTEAAPPPDSLQQMMGEIAGRLRRIEGGWPLRTEEAPPRYGGSEV